MEFLYKPLKNNDAFVKITGKLAGKKQKIGITGPSDSQKAHFSSAMIHETGVRAVFVTFNEMQARLLYEDFSFFFGEQALLFPAAEYILYDIEAKSHENSYKRLDVLGRVLAGDYRVLVLSAEAICQRLPAPEKFFQNKIIVDMDIRMPLELLQEKLLSAGYERTGTVSGKGQFAVRGGIVDIFPVNCQDTVRIDFFGDEVDSIRIFDVESQRSVENTDRVEIFPAREILFTDDEKAAVIEKIEQAFRQQLAAYEGNDAHRAVVRNFRGRINYDLDRFRNYNHFPGIDRYLPLILEQYSTILDYAADAVLFMDEPGRIQERIDNVNAEHWESCKNMLGKGLILNETASLYDGYQAFYRQLEDRTVVYINALGNFRDEGLRAGNIFNIAARTVVGTADNIDFMISQVKGWKEAGWKVAVLCGGKGRGERLVEIFHGKGIEAAFYEVFPEELFPGQVAVTSGSLHKSFEYPDIGFVVISEGEFFASPARPRLARKKKGKAINAFTDLEIGDYVVHEYHGIGQYEGLEQIEVSGIKRDYIKIRYRDNGYLYVPVNQMELVQKYIGTEGKEPRLNKLGSGEWAKTKSKVKESLKELAKELVELYAKRQASKGFAFSPDTVWQKQFEEAFPYIETEDQLRCVEEIKRDMESPRPMERLLCGDVGYGKTEVALRAAFKAVMDGKQVAFLVPTTILAQQHYNTIKERLGDFPVRVDYICRFRTAAEQREIIKKVKRGEIDILVGTHRLIQKDVEFKDLGLLIIDEEHRFGVVQKEKLKKIKPNIDILSLSATPIPRTLHMSLVSIRDISIIEEPPQERFPVQTYVMEYNEQLIRDAIYREMARKGQVFYLYNRVKSIDVKAMDIKRLVPEARIAVAHGQMSERELEDIMQAFIEGKYDIIVCTTIIESGLDMPNVNTIIVEDADRLGLAQLYQIRGRVGRSNRLAYAYLTYRKDKQLTETSEKRLKTIREFTEFGSGFKIALRDLEIRGAGNLLGTQQHGQMESVGYDMYCRLLERAIREIKNGEEEAHEELAEDFTIDISISAYIDKSYIPDEEERLEIYKKISLIETDEDAADIIMELTDRYGDVPEETENLVNIARLKARARKKGFSSIAESRNLVIMKYRRSTDVDLEAVSRVVETFRGKILFNAGAEPYIAYRISGADESRKILLNNLIKLFDVY